MKLNRPLIHKEKPVTTFLIMCVLFWVEILVFFNVVKCTSCLWMGPKQSYGAKMGPSQFFPRLGQWVHRRMSGWAGVG